MEPHRHAMSVLDIRDINKILASEDTTKWIKNYP